MTVTRLKLSPSTPSDFAVKGIVFDMDGTLCQPQTWMFGKMREALGIVGQNVDIIDKMSSLQGDEKLKAENDIKAIEHQAMEEMEAQTGLEELFLYLQNTDLKKTICTRNNIEPVIHLKSNILPKLVNLHEPLITRDFDPPKPSPLPLLHIAKSWGTSPENMIMVGDSRDDMIAGLKAGFAVILMRHKDNGHLMNEIPEIDYAVDSLAQIIKLLEEGFEKKPRTRIEFGTTNSGY